MAEGNWHFTPESFEEFTRVLALKIFGPGLTPFGDGPDGGREATFDGSVPFPHPPVSVWNGYGVIQAKCKARSETSDEDQKWALDLLSSELQKFVEGPRRRRKPQYYVFVTNVVLSSATNGGIDKANQLCKSFYKRLSLLGHDIWDWNKLSTLLKAHADLRFSFPDALIPGDALAYLIGAKQITNGRLGTVPLDSLSAAGDISGYAKTFTEQAIAAGLLPSSEQNVGPGVDDTYAQLPAPLAIGSRREESVASVLGHFNCSTWLAIYGDPALGKTQLANLVTNCHQTRKWVGFKDMDAQTARFLLRKFVQNSTSRGTTSFAEQCSEFIKHLNGGFLVLDDLPRIESGGSLSADLALIAAEAKRVGCRLISTSVHRLPLALSSSLGGIVAEIPSPAFTAKESGELLAALGMPAASLTEKRQLFLCGLAKGHPLLLIGIANYLKSVNWRFDEQSIAELLKGTHSDRVADEVMPKLLRIVPQSARDLLQRMCLIRASFSDPYIDHLARIAPQIARPREQLQHLLGFCVQRDGANRLSVAAIFDTWFSKGLEPNLKTQCHAAIGNQIISEGPLDQWSGFNAVVHLCAGGEWNKASLILITGLRSLDNVLRKDNERYSTAFVALWCDEPLPEKIDLGLRLTVRALQISIYHKLKKDNRWLIADFQKLLGLVGPNDPVLTFVAVFQACDAVGSLDADAGFELLMRGFGTVPIAREYLNARGHEFPTNPRIELMVLVAASWVRTRGHLDKWVALLKALTPNQRVFLRGTSGAGDCFLSVANRLWLKEAERPANERRWQSVELELLRSAKVARSLGFELLWAALIRASMIVRAEYQDLLEPSVELGERSLAAASNDPESQFILREALGRQLFFAGKRSEASRWLRGALEQKTTIYPLTRALAYAYASVAEGGSSPQSLLLIDSGVGLMRGVASQSWSGALERLEVVKLLCEKAEVEWRLGDLHAAYTSLCDAERILYGLEPTSDWKDVAVLFCHLLGYISAIASRGSPPTVGSDDEPYAAPESGIFLTQNSGRGALHSALRDNLRFLAFADFAEGVGEFKMEVEWAKKGIEILKHQGPSWTIAHLATYLMSDAIERGDFIDANEKMEMAAKYWAASKARRTRGEDDIGGTFDPDEVLRSEDPQLLLGWREYLSLPLIIGMSFRIGMSALEDENSFQELLISSGALCQHQINGETLPTLWRAAGEVFRTIAAPGSTGRDLVRIGNTNDESGVKTIKIVAYLGATIKQRGEPGDAVLAHLAVFPFIQHYLRGKGGIYRLGLEFLYRYWNHELEKAPFRFRTPQLVRQELSGSNIKPASYRAQYILRTVVMALNTHIDPRVKEWLYGK